MYQEKQKFSQWWLWTILLGVSALVTYAIFQQVIMNEPFGDNPMSDSGIIMTAILMYGLSALFFYIRLDTRIDRKNIYFSFVPFLRKSVAWKNVKSAKVLDYGTVGGWGIKNSSKYGTVYATGGDMGLAISMKNGYKFVIGTQNENELKKFLEESQLLEGSKD